MYEVPALKFFLISTENKDVCRLLVLSDSDDLVVGRVLIWKFLASVMKNLKTLSILWTVLYY
jgi:hypothetical protein